MGRSEKDPRLVPHGLAKGCRVVRNAAGERMYRIVGEERGLPSKVGGPGGTFRRCCLLLR